MRVLIATCFRNRSGATAIEYGLIMCLIMVAILVGVTTLGTQLNSLFDNISSTIESSPAG